MIFRAGSFRLRAIPRLLAFNGASFFAPLTNSLTLARGAGSPTFTRATTAMQQDGDGKYNQVSAGEARFQGMRREQNLLIFSEDFSNAAWRIDASGAGVLAVKTPNYGVAPDGTLTACRIQLDKGATVGFSRVQQLVALATSGLRTNTIFIKTTDGSSKTICFRNGTDAINFTITGIWQRITNPGGTLVTNRDIQIILWDTQATSQTADLLIWNPSSNDVTGRSNQNPPEYIPSTWNDTGAAGVRYFPYANGNTVLNNVVTAAQGAALPNAGKGNYLSEAAATNIALWCRNLTNAAWTKTNITPTLTATGIDGVTNSASTLTATAINGTVLQAVTLASSTRAQSAFVRRRTGTGAISMTTDGGTTYTDITAQLGATFALVQITQAAVTNPSFGFKIATSGDAIDVDFVQNETGTFATSPILTTTVAVTRNGDVENYPTAGNILAAQCTIYGEFYPNNDALTSLLTLDVDANNYLDVNYNYIVSQGIYVRKSVGGTLVSYGSAVNSAPVGALAKWAITYGPNGFILCLNGVIVSSASVTVLAALPASMLIMTNRVGTGQSSNNGGNYRAWPTQLPNAMLRALTL